MKSSNKLNRSAEPNSKLWFRHRASSVLSSNRSTTYELSKSSYFVLLFSSLIGYFVTSNCTLLPLLLWLAFWSASVWNTRYGSSSRTSYSALCAYSGQVAGFFIDSSSSFIQGNDWNKQQKSHLISQNVFLQRLIYPSEERKKIIGTSSILAWRKSRVIRTDPPFYTMNVF